MSKLTGFLGRLIGGGRAAPTADRRQRLLVEFPDSYENGESNRRVAISDVSYHHQDMHFDGQNPGLALALGEPFWALFSFEK